MSNLNISGDWIRTGTEWALRALSVCMHTGQHCNTWSFWAWCFFLHSTCRGLCSSKEGKSALLKCFSSSAILVKWMALAAQKHIKREKAGKTPTQEIMGQLDWTRKPSGRCDAEEFNALDLQMTWTERHTEILTFQHPHAARLMLFAQWDYGEEFSIINIPPPMHRHGGHWLSHISFGPSIQIPFSPLCFMYIAGLLSLASLVAA